MSLALPWQALVGLVVGLACTAGHLALLRGQLDGIWQLESGPARARLLRGLPLRLLLWAPAVLLTLRLGWVACAALFVALIIGRWLLLGAMLARRPELNEACKRGC